MQIYNFFMYCSFEFLPAHAQFEIRQNTNVGCARATYWVQQQGHVVPIPYQHLQLPADGFPLKSFLYRALASFLILETSLYYKLIFHY